MYNASIKLITMRFISKYSIFGPAQTDRQTDIHRQTDRQTDRKINTETESGVGAREGGGCHGI